MPFPRFTLKASRSAELLPPRLRFRALSADGASALKKCCSWDCAATAESRVSCCRMKRTATRAKSRVVSVVVKLELGLGVEEDAEEVVVEE